MVHQKADCTGLEKVKELERTQLKSIPVDKMATEANENKQGCADQHQQNAEVFQTQSGTICEGSGLERAHLRRGKERSLEELERGVRKGKEI